MIYKTSFFFIGLFLSGCATGSKCGNVGDSQTVFSDTKTCQVRIRQVLVASKMNLPKSVSASDLTTWQLQWVGSEFDSGRIAGGHYILVPPNMEQK